MVRRCLSSSLPTLLHIFWGRELWLKHIAAPHPGWAPHKWWWGEGCERHKRCAGEVGEESSLKRLVKIMKTNGNRVSRDGENFICEVSLAGFCCTTASWFITTIASRRHAWQRGNRQWKMRALILIIVQGQLFPHWSNSCWCVLACTKKRNCWM